MFRHFLAGAILGFTLAGCAAMDVSGTGSMPTSPPRAFAHYVSTSEVALFWNCERPEPGRLLLDGVAKNPWQAQPVRFLEFQLVGVDARERTTAQTAGAAQAIQIFTNQQTPFRLDLKTTGSEVRFDLYYQYRFELEFDMSLQVAGPPVVGPRLLAQTNTFLARDVCNETQHRAR